MEQARNDGGPRRTAENPAARVGVISNDPLRLVGLKAICADALQTNIEPMSVETALNEPQLSLVLIDGETTAQVFEVIVALRRAQPAAKLLVLGNSTTADYIERIIGAGAKGYLTLGAPESEVRMAIQIVQDGSIWAPRKILARLLDRRQAEKPGQPVKPVFTARERDVLGLLHAGRSNREIARALRIDESTVKAHVGRLMRKVGVSNRIALTVHPLTKLQ